MLDLEHERIECQLSMLLRRAGRLHLFSQSGEIPLERSAYGIMCQLADNGPQRMGTLATTFGMNPSTITRQAMDLEKAGFTKRSSDPCDARATMLALTPAGRAKIKRSRERRRARLQDVFGDWEPADLSDFSRLLRMFNVSIDRLSPDSPMIDGRRGGVSVP